MSHLPISQRQFEESVFLMALFVRARIEIQRSVLIHA